MRIKHKIKQGDRETYRMVQEYYLKGGYVWCSTGNGLWYPDSLNRRDQFINVEENPNHLSCGARGYDEEITPNFMCDIVPEALFAI